MEKKKFAARCRDEILQKVVAQAGIQHKKTEGGGYFCATEQNIYSWKVNIKKITPCRTAQLPGNTTVGKNI